MKATAPVRRAAAPARPAAARSKPGDPARLGEVFTSSSGGSRRTLILLKTTARSFAILREEMARRGIIWEDGFERNVVADPVSIPQLRDAIIAAGDRIGLKLSLFGIIRGRMITQQPEEAAKIGLSELGIEALESGQEAWSDWAGDQAVMIGGELAEGVEDSDLRADLSEALAEIRLRTYGILAEVLG